MIGRPILKLGLLPTAGTSTESVVLALGAGGLGFVLSFLGWFWALGYLQRLSSLTVLNQRAKSTLQRTGLIRTIVTSHDTASRGYSYKRVAWYRYMVDGSDHEIAGQQYGEHPNFPLAAADCQKNPWKPHRTVHYLSADPAHIRHFHKKLGNPIWLILGGPAWLGGLCLLLLAGARLRY